MYSLCSCNMRGTDLMKHLLMLLAILENKAAWGFCTFLYTFYDIFVC